MKRNSAVFIVSHERAKKVPTFDTLKKHGYSGKVFIVIDDSDTQQEVYKKIFSNNLVVFNKKAFAYTFDAGDNFDGMRGVIYARNAINAIAVDMKLTHYLVLDDDYNNFAMTFDNDWNYKQRNIKNIDKVIDLYFDYLDKIPALSIAFAQRGDFIGGVNSDFFKKGIRVKRKVMNAFFCKTDRPFNFVGRVNEDVNTYVTGGHRGELFLTVPIVSLNQATTQKNAGGMTEIYLANGTYTKSFYSVMYSPSSVTVKAMGPLHRRLHHNIIWNNTTPMILRPEIKKV